MKITIIASAETTAALLNPNAPRRQRYKKDMSAKGIAARRKAKLNRTKNKSKIARQHAQYLKRNKAQIAKRRKVLEKKPQLPVKTRASDNGADELRANSMKTGRVVFRASAASTTAKKK